MFKDIFAFPPEYIQISNDLVHLCKSKEVTIAVAESCTGGMVCSLLTEIAGSSAVLDCGFVTYANEAKIKMLGVSHSSLEAHGAVSAEVAKEMLLGVLKNTNVQLAAAITGIAGPGGGSPEKPVGTVYIAVSYLGRDIVQKFHFTGNRQQVRLQTAYECMLMMKWMVQEH